MRVAVTYRVLQHWRLPVFKRLAQLQDVSLKIFHSKGIKGTKLVNAKDVNGVVHHKELFTIGGQIKSSGRKSPVLFCPSLLIHLINYNPDVILSEGGSNLINNIIVFIYSTIWRKPVVWWTLGELPGRKYYGFGKIYRRFVELMEKRSAALVGYSTIALAYFDRMGYVINKCFKAVNCVDTDEIDRKIPESSIAAESLRIKYGICKKKVILFVGAITQEKRIDRLLYAFKRVMVELEDIVLLIVGSGPEIVRIKELATQLDLHDSVIFTGEIIDGVDAYFQLADVFVLPGLGGLAISEALAHGLPVICTQGDGCERDLVINGETGYRFCNSSDDDELTDFIADKMTEILQDMDFQMYISNNAQELIRNKYNIGNYVRELKRALDYACEYK